MSGTWKAAGLFVLLVAARAALAQPEPAGLRIEPREIPVDLLYDGAQIQVSGEGRAGEDPVVVCSGDEGTVELKEKRKVWSLFWMNAGDIIFKNVPSLYQVVSSRRLGDLAGEAELIHAGVGFPALEAKIAAGMDDVPRSRFSELLKLKQQEGLYSIREESMEIRPREGGRQEFSATFRFPSNVAPGKYRFRLINFVEGRSAASADGVISVRMAGTAAFIRSLSMNHGLAYGILSVIIALVAGMLTGFIFGRHPRKGVH